VILYTDEDGNWIAEVPSLPGCGSDGKTRDEAPDNVRDAIEGYIDALRQDGIPVPEPDDQFPTLAAR
jgi:predicted RNase H-like HicB family nuclease